MPGPARLVQSGWTACTGDGPRLRVRVAASQGARPVPRGGVVVASRGAHYVVAPAGSDSTGAPTAHAYRLPGGSRRAEGDEQDTLLDELGLPIRRRLLGCPPGGSRSSPRAATWPGPASG